MSKDKVIIPRVSYHGTISLHVDSILEGIRFNINPGRRDFGQGFYITTDFEQAAYWANRKATYENKNRKKQELEPVKAVVVYIEIDLNNLLKLEGKFFSQPDVIWAEFVYNNRMGTEEANHNYDYIFGPLADGTKLWPELDKYRNGGISIQKLARLICPQRNQNQLSLHTSRVLECIKVVGLKGVGYNG